MRLRVGFTYNARGEMPAKPGDPADVDAEFDREETLAAIEQALLDGGHTVVRIGNVQNLIRRLDGLDVDIVFNIAEGIGGRNRESQVPILLEIAGIPYVGSDGLSLALTLDKVLAKKLFLLEGVPTPGCAVVGEDGVLNPDGLRFPLIVKLRCEGSSKGLTESSVVENRRALDDQVRRLQECYPGAAIFAEEFIAGEECTVLIIGNENPEVFPIVQTTLPAATPAERGRRFYTAEWVTRGSTYVCPAAFSPELTEKVRALALKAYRAVDCRDFGRVDFRIDAQGNPYVLEINPLPTLSTEDSFTYSAEATGTTYKALINRVLDVAAERCGLAAPSVK